jgi:hypothetical protein
MIAEALKAKNSSGTDVSVIRSFLRQALSASKVSNRQTRIKSFGSITRLEDVEIRVLDLLDFVTVGMVGGYSWNRPETKIQGLDRPALLVLL